MKKIYHGSRAKLEIGQTLSPKQCLIGFIVIATLTICGVFKNSDSDVIKFGAEPVYGMVHMIWDNHFDIDTISAFTGVVPELVALKDKSIYDSIYIETQNGRPDLDNIANGLTELINANDVRVRPANDAYLKFWNNNADVLNQYLNDTNRICAKNSMGLYKLEKDLSVFFDVSLIRYTNYFVPFTGNGSGGVSIGDGAIVGINTSRKYTQDDVLFYISVVFHEWNHAMFTKSDLFAPFSQKFNKKDFLLFQEVLATAYQGLVLETIGGNTNQPLYDNAEYDRLARKFMPVLKDSFKRGVRLDYAWIAEFWYPIVESQPIN